MRHFVRLIFYFVIFIFTFSVFSVLVLGVVPVTVTPLKVMRLLENMPEEGFTLKSKWCGVENINPVMVTAVVSTEDGNFMKHNGFDFEAINKAMKNNRRGKKLRGASTISQQTAKNVFCTPHRTWVRKGVETYFTFLIETFWSKRRIMEVYLNIIETHANIYGVEATAGIFYRKPASKLNSYEASMIATVLPNPLRMNLGEPSRYMVSRAAAVRAMMSNTGEVDLNNRNRTVK